MASSLLLLPSLPLSLRPSLSSFTTTTTTIKRRRTKSRRILTTISCDADKSSASDRVISAACYLYPFLDGVQYGKYVLTQFPSFQLVLQPLLPAIRLFRASPFTGFLLFLTLYFAVVRNPSAFSRYVRFNTMQAIVLDVLLIFPDLLERTFNPRGGVALDFVMSLDSTVFFFLLVSLVYGSTSCLLGQLPRLPIVADAAERQIL
ncbi:protein TIC 20-v, chloroplastic [Dioscorea cayenensis subsp. rotundata]|uniref:Protein TIC 20 n=1 Tax=Dioscorea cayennensis subsp. rotundata TaxID=55577 RepID=A0AB40ANB2_DIOCR|nr:protein TIC 20-v, chloroplastic [Dioscorea cayenensis subsp. rotundata]XP_039116278.1 protein TIC 20-v, chloroplastic [Dioscorea cayenensis subsp. rotundata]